MADDAELIAALSLRRLAENYARAVDLGDGDLFAAQFTSDGVLDAPRGRFVGREALASVPPMMRKRYSRTFHAVFNQIPTFDGDRASAETYCIARHFYADKDGARLCYEMTIRYLDEFSRGAEGWLISKRALIVDATQTFAIDAN